MSRRRRVPRRPRRQPKASREAREVREIKSTDVVEDKDRNYAEERLDLLRRLNAEQKAFCEYYVETRDVAKSYGRAYPNSSETSSAANGFRLLRNDNVQEYIKVLITDYGLAPRLGMDEILAEIERIAMDDNIANYQKLKALTLLGQTYGQLVDKVEVATKEFVIDIVDEDEE